MMRRIIAILLILSVLILLLLRISEKEEAIGIPSAESSTNNDVLKSESQTTALAPVADPAATEILNDEAAKERFLKAFGSPIEFYGQVVDENEKPIQGASIEFIVTDRPFENGSRASDASDDNGLFSLSSNGAAISVQISKDGYYTTEQSKGVFRYSIERRVPMPTEENPAVFVLRKAGERQSLRENDVRFRISRNGAPKYVDLATGNSGTKNDSSLKVEAWTNDSRKDERGRYDWRVRLSIEGGGLIERKDRYAFVAPELGYTESVEIGMPSDDESWSPHASKDYFVILADGAYARVSFRMIAGGDNFFTLKSWYNPTGSPNLE